MLHRLRTHNSPKKCVTENQFKNQMAAYPSYKSYSASAPPSVLFQRYLSPSFGEDEFYYPTNKLIEPFLTSKDEARKFGAVQFCGFLRDTVEIEHRIVIPSITALRDLPYALPSEPRQDLFKVVTDEGFHAEQALKFLNDLELHFNFELHTGVYSPKFLGRIYLQSAECRSSLFRNLISILNAIVTETKISAELGRFSVNEFLGKSVRDLCRSHADDESIHSSQFRALCLWLWKQFDAETRENAAAFIATSVITMNCMDVERLALFFKIATGRSMSEARKMIIPLFNSDMIIDQLISTARPTINLIKLLGKSEYAYFQEALAIEKSRLDVELHAMIHAATNG